MIERLAKWLTRKPRLVALAAVIMLIPAAIGYISTRINYDILSYLPEDLESSQGEKLLEEPFKMAATSMLIVENMPAGYTNSLINDIKAIDGVSNAIWISNLMGIQIPTDMIPANFRDMFFAGDATMMIIQYSHPGASDETMECIEQVRKVCNEKCFLAGFSVVIKDTRDLMDSELPMFVGLAVLLALCAMLLTLESTVLPFIFLASIGFAVIYNFGSNIFLGEISYITKAIAAVLQLGVTMDYSIFLYHRYEEERANYTDNRDAMAAAIVAAFRSLSSSSVTTIAGFLALCVMRLTLGRDIGIVMAKGVVLGVATVILVLPSLVLIFDKQITKHKHRSLLPSFDRMNTFVLRHHRAIMVLFILLFIPAYYAQSHAGIYYKLDESLPRDLPSIVSNEKLKDDFDMATSHFIVLRDDLTPAEMSDIETRMEAAQGHHLCGLLPQNTGDRHPGFLHPGRREGYAQAGRLSAHDGQLQLRARYRRRSGQLDEMNAILKEYDEHAMITGEGAMYRDLIDTTAVDFVVANYLSIACIFLIVAWAFKSISIPAVLVATIELAIFLNQGFCYFSGASTPFIAPTIISCVQLGATVDYAILMSSRFQEELQSGKSRIEAIRIAADSSDASIITSALVLFCATLGVSFVSSIDLIGAICIMLARGALISACICLLVMPAVLYVCEPVFNKTTLHWRTPAPPQKPRIAKASKKAIAQPASTDEATLPEQSAPEAAPAEEKERDTANV